MMLLLVLTGSVYYFTVFRLTIPLNLTIYAAATLTITKASRGTSDSCCIAKQLTSDSQESQGKGNLPNLIGNIYSFSQKHLCQNALCGL